MLSSNILRQTVYTHYTSVHQAAKLVAALLRVARVTAGLAESNVSLPPGLWLTSPAGWLASTGISSEAYVQQSSIGYLYFFTSDYLCYLRKKTICNPFAHPTWKCTRLTCEVPNFFLSDWRFALYLHFPYMRFPCLRNVLFRTVRAFSVLAFSSTCVFSAPILGCSGIRWTICKQYALPDVQQTVSKHWCTTTYLDTNMPGHSLKRLLKVFEF